MRIVLLWTADAKIKIEAEVFVFGTDCERLFGGERYTSLKPPG